MSMSVRKAGKKRSVIKPALCFLLCAAFLSGCLSGSGTGPGSAALKTIKEDTDVRESAGEPQTGQETAVSGPAERLTERAKKSLEEKRQPQIMETDWSEYFQGLNGTAVLYDAEENRYLVYNPELAETRRSPCSTFKIISSLLALENGVIDPENSVRKWSGEYFWNGEWNRDIGFEDAFHASCVWYFRQVVDDIGKERMQEGLDALRYGNCDISDWEGSLNTNNSNRALTGFWIESSLKISPREQTEVMERIFGEDGYASAATGERLKQVMLLQEEDGLSIYGKTGMGKASGVTVDAWYTGFAETPEGNRYFCVWLGQTDGVEVTSVKAREIAVRMINDHWRME